MTQRHHRFATDIWRLLVVLLASCLLLQGVLRTMMSLHGTSGPQVRLQPHTFFALLHFHPAIWLCHVAHYAGTHADFGEQLVGGHELQHSIDAASVNNASQLLCCTVQGRGS